MNNYQQKMEKAYALKCKQCEKKVLDPDKKNNQEFIKYKCSACGFDYSEFKRAQKNGLKKTN
jgi:predicted RNA-binding Zn-ribbon protein involved in translation (DUF1610 family)